MSCSHEIERLKEPEFKWLQKRRRRGKNKDVQFYSSFTYDGVDYALYDCVYMYKEGEEPYIGKLVKIWENADKSKKIKVQWFFRPSEISYYLKDEDVLENELFFASGEGTGLVNLNPLVSFLCNIFGAFCILLSQWRCLNWMFEWIKCHFTLHWLITTC